MASKRTSRRQRFYATRRTRQRMFILNRTKVIALIAITRELIDQCTWKKLP